jgi:alpha-glucosidase
VLDFVDKANKHDIPCDGFHLSSGYTTGEDGKRYVFNWNKRRFKDPQKFVEQMKKKGIVLSPNVKPGMLVTHPLYDKFKEKEAYILDNKGENPHIDRYWGGKASFVDFTNPAARELWKKHMKEAIISLGITAIWNDNCEYEINDPEAICSFEDQKAAVSTLRPILPNLMALAAYQAVLEMYPDTRPYILNRAGFAGIQRYAQTWAGDNYTSWKSLKFNIPVMLGMGLSGVANQGIDIGGFDGPAPEPELLVRWVQNAAFYPRFCIHSCNTDNTVTEPWMYPSYTHYIREAIKFRYRLIPYLYSLIHEASTVGSPVMRPLLYEFQEDTKVYEESFDFMCGPYLLVAGVFEKGQKQRTVYLPQGSEWYDWDTREKYQGGQEITVETPLDKIPVFFRSGSIIPMSESRNNLQLEKITKLNLLIEPWAKSEFVLYEDDGTSNQYLNGQYCKTHITVANADTHISIAFNSCGNYKSEVTDICLDVVCRDAAPLSIKIDDNKLKAYLDKDEWQKNQEGWYYSAEKRSVQIKYKKPDHSYRVSISFSVKDLISI